MFQQGIIPLPKTGSLKLFNPPCGEWFAVVYTDINGKYYTSECGAHRNAVAKGNHHKDWRIERHEGHILMAPERTLLQAVAKVDRNIL